jgi:hypothetical protein
MRWNDWIQLQHARISHWLPALLTGAFAGVLFWIVGETPLLRAVALAIVIVGVALSVRRLGWGYSVLCGLALASSPAYWDQTGGGPTLNGWLVLLFMVFGGGGAAVLLLTSKRVFASFAVGLALFVGLYLVFGITQKSLRLTTILAAWLVYMTIMALRQTNPRPEEPPARPLSRRHVLGILLLLTLGVLNDPLFTLFAPAVILGLWLSRAQLPAWYWLVMVGVTVYGVVRMFGVYVSPEWTLAVSGEVTATGQSIPYIVLDGWQDPQRWLGLTLFMGQQVGAVGIFLGVFGIARLSRWYPTLGVVLMAIYSMYGLFGLTYFGGDRDVLLLPILMIHVICATYAVYALVSWGARSVAPLRRRGIFGGHPQSNV